MEPDRIDLVQELRRTVGLFDGAMAISPKQAWEEAIAEVERLRSVADGYCWSCGERVVSLKPAAVLRNPGSSDA